MSDFAELRFETGYIIYGTQGGVQFNTEIVEVNSGAETRNSIWNYAKSKWDFGDRKLSDTELSAIITFFRARKGRKQGFRFKDWADFKDDGSGILGLTGLSDGTAGPVQMVKKYTSGSETDLRLISKPVAGTVKVFKNAVQTADWTINTSTGLVTFTAPLPAVNDVITWTGEFDVPVRFDVDALTHRFESAIISSPGVVSKPYFYISSLPLVEVRV